VATAAGWATEPACRGKPTVSDVEDLASRGSNRTSGPRGSEWWKAIMVNGLYMRGLGETEAEKAARKQAGRAARQAAASGATSTGTVVGGTTTTGGSTTGTGSTGAPAPTPAPAATDSGGGFSLSGLFSGISPPVMMVGIAVIAILLLKRR